MDKNEMGIELLKLYFDDFSKKHEHLWKLYFKFVYAIVFVLGVFLVVVLSRVNEIFF